MIDFKEKQFKIYPYNITLSNDVRNILRTPENAERQTLRT
jgi:hypothetical protein